MLVKQNAISQDQLVAALQIQHQLNVPLGQVLLQQGWIDSATLFATLAEQSDTQPVDIIENPADTDLVNLAPYETWLSLGVMPWRLSQGVILVASSTGRLPEQARKILKKTGRELRIIHVDRWSIVQSLCRQYPEQMTTDATFRVAERLSCRTWRLRHRLAAAVPALAILLLCTISLSFGMALLTILATTSLLLFAGLRAAGFIAQMSSGGANMSTNIDNQPPPLPDKLPKVSVLVPLYREAELATKLVKKILNLSYPKSRLQVILVLEQDDPVTHQVLQETDLPFWIQTATVPNIGRLRTKPRALNYALKLSDGDIIGVWDAEDAPAKNQIECVVSQFTAAPRNVVCLQGILDYYNWNANWLTRCFTIEYSSWFRVVLPGLARIGLPLPLGGTTMFIRRSALDILDGWDAHNVTEDADLGIRIYRYGWQTQMLNSVTREEATSRPWAWVRQRSRWLKGFMMTYVAHMRQPRRLWRELGLWRFLGVQAFFLGTCGQFLLAPVVWSFWISAFGGFHPAGQVLPSQLMVACAILFLTAELTNMAIGWVSVGRPGRRRLRNYLPTMMAYYLLGSIAGFKALYELIFAPFFWDKTNHGHDLCNDIPIDMPSDTPNAESPDEIMPPTTESPRHRGPPLS
jgi:cellulose synthase/poly-beta-1,6-N-acetylglucosamine synthase-like glycosyltransferase